MATINLNTKLSPPPNLQQVANRIRRQLGNISVTVNVKINQTSISQLSNLTKALGTVNAALLRIPTNVAAANAALASLGNTVQSLKGVNNVFNNVNNTVQKTNKSLGQTGNIVSDIAQRFSAFVIVSQIFQKTGQAISAGVDDALKFQRELITLKQVGDDSSVAIKAIGDEAIRLGKTLGTSSLELIKVASTLRQAGLSAKDTQTALETLAKTRVSPSFTDLSNTVEGAIAIIGQFGLKAGDLEKAFNAINSVSKAFAVESNDLITGIRLAGSSFSQAGGSLEEFLAVFTTIRATTRQSAETIGNGLKSIFTRLQRKDTVDALQQLGVNLRDAQGRFVGVFEAVRRLGEGLSKLDPKGQQFIDIAQLVGGVFQINKLLPLISNQKTLQESLNVAKKSSNSLDKDAATAQGALLVRLEKVKESFLEIFKILSENKTVNTLADIFIDAAQAATSLVKALEPLIPALVVFGAAKAGLGAGRATQGIFKAVKGFNTGGIVGGTGSGDTQPIMAEPGEFIIRKSVAQKIGYESLNKLNSGNLPGFASGGRVGGDLPFRNKAIQSSLTSGTRPLLVGRSIEEIRKAINNVTLVVTAGVAERIKESVSEYSKALKEREPKPPKPPVTLFDSANIVSDAQYRIRLRTDRAFRRAAARQDRGPQTFGAGIDTERPIGFSTSENQPIELARPGDPIPPAFGGVSYVNPVRLLPKRPRFSPVQFVEKEYQVEAGSTEDLVQRRARARRYAQSIIGTQPRIKTLAEIEAEERAPIGIDAQERARKQRQAFLNREFLEGRDPYRFNSANLRSEEADLVPLPIPSPDASIAKKARRQEKIRAALASLYDQQKFDRIRQARFKGVTGGYTRDEFDFLFPKVGGRQKSAAEIRDEENSLVDDYATQYKARQKLQDFLNAEFLAGRDPNRFNSARIRAEESQILGPDSNLSFVRQANGNKRVRAFLDTLFDQKRFDEIDQLRKQGINGGLGQKEFDFIYQSGSQAFRRPFNPNDLQTFFYPTPADAPRGRTRSELLRSYLEFGRSRSRFNFSTVNRRVLNGEAPFNTPVPPDQINADFFTGLGTGGIKGVRSLFEGKKSINKNQDKLDRIFNDVRDALFKQVVATRGTTVATANYGKILQKANELIAQNVNVQTRNGRVTQIVGQQEDLAKFSAGLGRGVFSRFFGSRNAPGVANAVNTTGFSGYSGVVSPFVTTANLFQGLSSNGQVGGTTLTVPAQRGRLGRFARGVGRFAGPALLAGGSFLAERELSRNPSKFSRVTSAALDQGLIGASLGGAVGGVRGAAIGGAIGGIAGGVSALLGGGSSQQLEQARLSLLSNKTLQAYQTGEFSGIGKAGSNQFLNDLIKLNNISQGQFNNFRSNNSLGVFGRLGRGEFGSLFSSESNAEFAKRIKQENPLELAKIGDDARGLAERLFQDRLSSGKLTASGFGKFERTPEFKQIVEGLSDRTAGGTDFKKIRDSLLQQVKENDAARKTEAERAKAIKIQQNELNKLNVEYAKTISFLDKFASAVNIASVQLEKNFARGSFRLSAGLGQNATQSFRFQAEDFGPQGRFLAQIGREGGVADRLRAGLPGLIENAIKTFQQNPNISLDKTVGNQLVAGGVNPEIARLISGGIKNYTGNLQEDFTQGKSGEVIDRLLRPLEPFVDGYKKLTAEGLSAGQKFVDGLSQYADNIKSLNEGLGKSDTLQLNAQSEFARVQAFNSFGRVQSDFLNLNQLSAPFAQNQARLTGLAGNAGPEAIGAALTQQRAALNQAIGANDPQKVQQAQSSIQNLVQALENLTDVGRSAAGVQEKLGVVEDRIRSDRQSRLSSTENFINASGGERRQIIRNRFAAQQAIAGGGLQNLPGGALGRASQAALAGLAELGNQQIFTGFSRVQSGVDRRGRAIFRNQANFDSAANVREALLARVGGAGGAGVNALENQANTLRTLLNQANQNAIAAQDILNRNLNETNRVFLEELKGIFTQFFGGAGVQNPLQNRQNQQGNNAGLKSIAPNPNLVNNDQSVFGVFNNVNNSVQALNKTLATNPIPSEIKVTLNSSPIVVELNGAAVMNAISADLKKMVFETIAAKFNDTARDLSNEIPFKA